MPSKREIAWRLDDEDRWRVFVGHGEQRPETPLAALMECKPHQEPERSCEELLPLRDLIQDAIDSLPGREKWVFDGYFVRRMSLRALAAELGISKTYVADIRDRACELLREHLSENDLIINHLRGRT